MHPMLRHPLRFRRDHRFAAEHASEYLDGLLDDAGRTRVERHARFCTACHELLASLRRTVDGLRALGTSEHGAPDSGVAPAVIARLRTQPCRTSAGPESRRRSVRVERELR